MGDWTMRFFMGVLGLANAFCSVVLFVARVDLGMATVHGLLAGVGLAIAIKGRP